MCRTRKMVGGTLFGVVTLTGAVLSLAMASASLADTELDSGKEKGEKLPAYHPKHVSGPDKQTDTCPVCQYPKNPAVQVWVNTDDKKNVTKIVESLEKSLKDNADKKLKAFVVFFNPQGKTTKVFAKDLEKMAKENKVEKVSLTYLPNAKHGAIKDYEINTDEKVKNTVFVYKDRTVETKFVNFVADEKGLEALNAAIEGVLK